MVQGPGYRADNRSEIRDFLASRRAKLSPEQAGLPAGGRRRVPGLRREEVAVLAGVSTEWYTRLEKGHSSASTQTGAVAGTAASAPAAISTTPAMIGGSEPARSRIQAANGVRLPDRA